MCSMSAQMILAVVHVCLHMIGIGGKAISELMDRKITTKIKRNVFGLNLYTVSHLFGGVVKQ